MLDIEGIIGNFGNYFDFMRTEDIGRKLNLLNIFRIRGFGTA